MKRIWNPVERWLERIGIHIIALASLITLIYATAQSYIPKDVPVPGTQEADPEPWMYDLSLGLLAAYAFNYLVVVLPAKKKQASRLLALSTPLRIIACNGHDLVRDLERIAQCPAMPIAEQHLAKVFTALNDNPHVKAHIAERMHQAADAYADIVPYAADLPLDLQELLQRENQNFLHESFREHKRHRYIHTVDVDLLREQGNPVARATKPVTHRRAHFAGWEQSFIWYYEQTEAVRKAVDKYTLPTRKSRLANDRPKVGPFRYRFGIEENDPAYPYKDYPETATNDDWVEQGSK